MAIALPTSVERQRGGAGQRGDVPFASAFVPLEIATDRCKGCELCVAACPHGVLALDPSVVNALGYHPVHLIDAEGCTSCVICARVCPDAVFAVFARPKAA